MSSASDADLAETASASAGGLPRVGIIGTGWGARVQLPALRAAGFVVTAIWGRSLAKAKQIADELNVPFATNRVDEMLMRKDVDLVVVASPPMAHADMVIKAINAGKHVICEKPPALNLAEATEMHMSARYYPKLLAMLSFQLRFLDIVEEMRTMVANGYLGRLLVMEAKVNMGSLIRGEYSWWCDESSGGGALSALGSHMVDALFYLTKARARFVTGVTRTYVETTAKMDGFRHITADDYCALQMKFDDNVYGSVVLNTHMPGMYEQEILLVGTAGRLRLRNTQLFGYKKGITDGEEIISESQGEGGPISPFVRGLERQCEFLRDAFANYKLDDLRARAASFKDGIYVQAVLDAVRESTHTGKWVAISRLWNDTNDHDMFPLRAGQQR